MKKVYSFFKNLSRSRFSLTVSTTDSAAHIRAAIDWLLRAQQMTPDGGVSAGFHLYHGWLPSYPETTGYIIETFMQACDRLNDQQLEASGLKMADWLLKIQNEDGSISDSTYSRKMVFDTGQVLFGYLSAFRRTRNQHYLDAAIKAGDWLYAVQEKDGSWVKHAVADVPHTYYSRVAWALLELFSATNEDKYKNACTKNLEWCLQQQNEHGWFNNAAFLPPKNNWPFTHTIAYTLRGILESGLSLQNERYILSVEKALDQIARKVGENGFVAGAFNGDWNGDNRFCCLTGSAQLAILFFKLAQYRKNSSYYSTGSKITEYIKSVQKINSASPDIKGGIPGSYPIWGKYIHFNYPNWAAKFFIESLLLKTDRLSTE